MIWQCWGVTVSEGCWRKGSFSSSLSRPLQARSFTVATGDREAGSENQGDVKGTRDTQRVMEEGDAGGTGRKKEIETHTRGKK